MSENTTKFKIANIPGDGIGNEVVPEGLRVLDAVGKKYGIEYDYSDYDWSCERYAKVGSMLYELRIYHCVTGRLPALLDRFENTTLKLWEKHGIRQAGFWTVAIGESNNDLYYMLEWESLAEREEKWNAFASDSDWLSARAESEKDGPIVASLGNQILQPTAFSSVK